MPMKTTLVAVSAVFAFLPYAGAQKCVGAKDAPLTGLVHDGMNAIVAGAAVQIDGGQSVTSAPDGQFRIACVAPGQHTLTVTASGFAGENVSVTSPAAGPSMIVLKPETATAEVTVNGNDTPVEPVTTVSGPSQTISGNNLQTLADDPDDLLRELQQLAAAAGGSPSAATVAVDGFENGEGGTHLPPKSSIAYIKVNPDLFSAEYREPPFGGGRIEIYTKPGQSAFHGALFGTNSSSWMNARNPFSTGSAPLGKQRYGFELTGPIRRGSDFFTALEHRSIHFEDIVNAVTVNAAGQESPLQQTVPASQTLWLGNGKVDWQLGEKNTFIVGIDTFNNDLDNIGVGGTSLAETGYENQHYDTNLHITDVTIVNAKIMHEARVGLEFDGYTTTPNSTGPLVSVAGAFTSGGNPVGNAHEHEIWSTIIDDAILQVGNHMIKVGVQPEFLHIVQHTPTNFNGTYSFGGGVTSTGATITGVQQYVNALNGAANGAPTTFSNVAGNPDIDIYQARGSAYVQDEWKMRSNLHVAYGLRYYGQSNPTNSTGWQPRLGVAWSPDKKATWNLHAHAGIFSGRNSAHNWGTILFSDGVQRVTSIVYNPACAGLSSAVSCNPLASGTVIHSVRSVQPNMPNLFWATYNLGFTKTFPKGWTVSGDTYLGSEWHFNRTENVNSPANGQPTGPRPYGANLNILQMQATGSGHSNVEFLGVSNQGLKKLQLFAGAARVVLIDDTDNNNFAAPQTTGVNVGEYARRTGQGLWNVFGNARVTLPAKLVWSATYNAQGMAPFNVTTGFDNNGDGDFNDRPQYAAAGTPLCSANPNASPCGYATEWGELVASGGTESLSRNKGVMPWTFYLDTNLQRTFTLTHDPKADHPQTLALNVRSSNVINHTNVTAVGNVLGSPLFGEGYTADSGRRAELGLRYAF